MAEHLEHVRLQARDLRTDFPRSPRDTTIGGFVIAARAVDKCRATLSGMNGEYNFDCSLDKRCFTFAGITGEDLKRQVATGATDAELSAWLKEKSGKTEEEIVIWNNAERDRRLSDLSPKSQVFMENYIRKHLPLRSGGAADLTGPGGDGAILKTRWGRPNTPRSWSARATATWPCVRNSMWPAREPQSRRPGRISRRPSSCSWRRPIRPKSPAGPTAKST